MVIFLDWLIGAPVLESHLFRPRFKKRIGNFDQTCQPKGVVR